MKKLSINKAIRDVKTYISKVQYDKKQKEINRLINIEGVTQPDAYMELYSARDILANYAKANNLKLSFKTVASDAYSSTPRLAIMAQKKNVVSEAAVNADTKAITAVVRDKGLMLENKDNLQYSVKTRDVQEDTFIRRVFRTIEQLLLSKKA